MRSRFSRFRLSPAFPISLLALFVALGGIAGAAATIGTKQLKNNSVTSKKIKNGTIKQGDLGFKVSGGAQGPAGPPGPPGTNGTNGSARAYGEITASAPFFDAARSKNVASVTNPSTGTFCVTFTAAAGIDPA